MKFALSALFSCLMLASACAHARSTEDATSYFGHIHPPCLDQVSEDASGAKCAAFKENLLALDNCRPIEAECAGATNLLKELFGGTRRTKFANYIVYFDQHNASGTFSSHQPVLVWNDKNTRYLSGVQEVYILLLTEQKTCFDAHVTTVAKSEPNPFELVLKAMGKPVGGPEASSLPKTQFAHLTWFPLSGDTETPVMWLAMGSAPIDVNTLDWITVRVAPTTPVKPDAAATVPEECVADPAQPRVPYKADFLAHNAFFSNNRGSRLGLGVAFGATWTSGNAVPLNGSGGNPSMNAYALGKFYPFRYYRPRLRADSESDGTGTPVKTVAFVLGTTLSTDAFKDVIGGISWGHILGNVGVLGGVNWFTPMGGGRRRVRPFFALDYSF